MKPATAKIHALRDKLRALAERGINGEREAAAMKLRRLESRYDFTKPFLKTSDLFAGVFRGSSNAEPVLTFSSDARDISASVKWAIEQQTKIVCVFRGEQLLARATPATAKQLHNIAADLALAFKTLWQQYASTPGSDPSDRGNFMLGLFDGMMHETRRNEQLPARLRVAKLRKAKKKAVSHAPGLSLHPYTIATHLGEQIRSCVPLQDVAGQLDRTIKGEIDDQKPVK